MTAPQCSIIIRAYNEEKHLGRLLQGIQEQSVKHTQIILVDSGSTDNTRLVARDYPVEIIDIAPHDFTFGRSLNLGIQHATAAIIVIASAHVYPVYPDWLERLIEPFENDRIALVYGKQRGAATTHFQNIRSFITGILRNRLSGSLILFAIMPIPPSAAIYGRSIPMMKRCPVWKTLNGVSGCRNRDTVLPIVPKLR